MEIKKLLKSLLIIVPILFIFCLEHSCAIIKNKQGEYSKTNGDTFMMKKIYFDCEIENVLSGNLYKKKLNLDFTNNTDENLIIGDPNCWINIGFELFSNNKEIPLLIKIKLNPECLKNEVSLKPGQAVRIIFKNDLNELFSLTKNNNYVLKVFYYGIISTDKGSILKTNKQILTSTKQFTD